MILYRILFVLAVLSAPIVALTARMFLDGGGSQDGFLLLALIAATAGVLVGSVLLARAGRRGAAGALLLLLVVPGLLVAGAFAYISQVGFGPHH